MKKRIFRLILLSMAYGLKHFELMEALNEQ